MRRVCLIASILACGDPEPREWHVKGIEFAAPPDAAPPEEQVVRVLRGVAIWYGANWHGKKTASGEPFDRHALTAAHRSLPSGSRVRVTNLANDRAFIVRINDRGPYGRDRTRIIDVSEAAARQLGFLDDGSTRVKVEVLAAP